MYHVVSGLDFLPPFPTSLMHSGNFASILMLVVLRLVNDISGGSLLTERDYTIGKKLSNWLKYNTTVYFTV